MRAAHGGQSASVRLLIDANAALDATNLVGEAALYLAAEQGKLEPRWRALVSARGGWDPAAQGPTPARRQMPGSR